MSEENKKTYHWDTGKGSRPRSYSVTQEEFKQKFDAIDWSVKISGGAKGHGMDAAPKLELCRCCHNERGMYENGQWVECPACKE